MSYFFNIDWNFLMFFLFFNLRAFVSKIKSHQLLMWFNLVFLSLNRYFWCKSRLFEANSIKGVMIKVSNHPLFDFMFKFFDIFPLRLFLTFTFSIIVFLKNSKRIIVVITVKLLFGIMGSSVLDEIEIFCFTFNILLELIVDLGFFISGNL